MLPSILLLAASASGATSPQCDAHTFSADLGNTHCPNLVKHESSTSPAECAAACCAAGDDACTTYQWCAPGASCEDGFWAQPGALSAGSDLPGWPQNTTVATAEAACTASPACIGYTYDSPNLHPGAATLKIYLKNSKCRLCEFFNYHSFEWGNQTMTLLRLLRKL